MSSDEEIEILINEIEQFKITTANNIRNLEKRVLEVKSSRRRKSRRSASRTRENVVTTGTVIINTSFSRDATFIIHQDKFGKETHRGDKVKFLTIGKYDSTEGFVVSFDYVWVMSRDYKGRLIKRTPKNLQVV